MTRTHPAPPTPHLLGEPVRSRSSLLCIVAGLILGFVSLAGLPTFQQQLREIDPSSLSPQERKARIAAIDAALQGQRRGLVVHRAIELLYRQDGGSLNLNGFEAADDGNGLYAYLTLLARLRNIPASQPAASQWNASADAIRATASAPPPRLYHLAMQREIEQSLLTAGLNPREAAIESVRAIAALIRQHHRPVIRELADRLMDLGAHLLSEGDPAAALQAQTAAVRLLTGIVQDSPTSDVALLAAERLPQALEAIARTRERQRDTSAATEAHMAALAAAGFPRDWHASTPDNAVNVIPFPGQVTANIAYPAQRPLVSAFTRAGAVSASYVGLLATLIVLGLIIFMRGGSQGVPLMWRGGTGPFLGTLIVLLPLLTLLVTPLGGRIPFVWVMTLKTGLSALCFTPIFFLALGLAGRLAVRLPEPLESERLPLRSVWYAVGAFALLLVCANLLLMMRSGSGSLPPVVPAAVRYFRMELVLAGLIGGLVAIVWFVAGMIRRRRTGLPSGLTARAQFAVVAQAFLVVAVLAPLALLANTRRDNGHQEAFATACADVVGDQLGAGWQARYFGQAATLATATAPAGP